MIDICALHAQQTSRNAAKLPCKKQRTVDQLTLA
jgi:hypothetical protein